MSEPNSNEELMQTAEMLEQILEVMPEDLFTLHALYGTYLKLEMPEKAFDCLKRLDDGARTLQNNEMIRFVLNQYEPLADDMPDIALRMERLRALLSGADSPDSIPEEDTPVERGSGIEAEMAMAWDLLQDEQLTHEEYSNVLHDLSEMSSRQVGVPITVLHILQDRNFSRFERLMTHLCQKGGVPIVPLSQFDEREELRTALPLDFISRNGALPFSEVGDDLLLAVLNPFDKELLAQASEMSGRRCHAYLVSPQEYDLRLEEIKKALA